MLHLQRAGLTVAHLTVAFALSACMNSSGDVPDGDDSSGSQSASDSENAEFVTLGVFFLKDDIYEYQEGCDLVMKVGEECYVWDRWTNSCDDEEFPGHDERHLHYNAADETSYVDRTFVWTEYGPKHSDEEIREFCAAGNDGEGPKEADWTTYFPEVRPGITYYLKIIAASDTEPEPSPVECGGAEG